MKVTEVGIKESRKLCCGKGYPQRDSAEHEGYVATLTDKRITANSGEDKLLERILSRANLGLLQNCEGVNLGTA